jgi:transglutaminase-like putative cysteine protease
VRRICQHVYRTFAYKPRSTGVATVATDAIAQRSGVCQDFAHVALGMCRCSGIPARYVSGYFIKVQRRPGEEEASHAWIEAFVPGYGWAAYDPTHDRAADERYVKVASGRDYGDIRPVSGTYRGGKTRSLEVEVRLREAEAAGAAR